MTDIALKVENVSKRFGDKPVLGNVNFEIPRGQIVALIGPSGCGKSTLFKSILGTDKPTEGTIYANGQPREKPSREVGIVYQDYALYEFLTARANVAFGLKLDLTSIPFRSFHFRKWWGMYRELLNRADEFLSRVKLFDARHRYPCQLSGGMQQRVALAQALIMEPDIVLLDEPFGALDEATREDLQMMLRELHEGAIKEGSPYTILIVTHELDEALFVADRIIGLSQYHERGGEIGATVVYDKPSPVYRPLAPKDCAKFFVQKEEMRQVIFEPGSDNGNGRYIKAMKDSDPPVEGDGI